MTASSLSRWLLVLVAGCASLPGATAQDSLVAVQGRVVDRDRPAATFPLLMVVNKTTGRGYFGQADGSFSLALRRTDTLLISVIGYQTRSLCFADSLDRPAFSVRIEIEKLHQELAPVDIFPERDLEKIGADIQDLGYDESDYRLTGIDAWSSPLTALYQEFSRKERDRRRAARLWNDQRRRDLIQELLRLYRKNDLIDLEPSAMESFTDFLHIDDAMMKSWSQYEMAVYIKSMYGLYRRRN